MPLTIEENSFKFNERNFAKAHGIAMGTKKAVTFSMVDLEKRLLTASPLKLQTQHVFHKREGIKFAYAHFILVTRSTC